MHERFAPDRRLRTPGNDQYFCLEERKCVSA
jgi:hypothetical protein